MTNTDSDNSREWAAQAYALLKKDKQSKKRKSKKRKSKKRKSKKRKSKKELIDSGLKEKITEPLSTVDEPELGEFDDNFTWSAMVLAAQGKKINQISIDEIDWLTKLRRGLEETRKGFVTELLDKLGDDPLTPESLDDLETLLIRADVGINSTDKVISSLRKKLNEEVVGWRSRNKIFKEGIKINY